MPRPSFLLPLVVITAAVIAGGCGSNSAVATTPTPVKCQVTLATPSPSVAAEGGAGSLTITTTPECPWDVSTAADWLSGLSPRSGQGSSTVEFKVAPNPLASTREGDLVVNDSRLRVSQQAAPCQFALQPENVSSPAAGETREVRVSTAGSCAWTAATNVEWITFTTPVSGTGAGAVGLRIAPNPTNDQRIGTITVGDRRATVAQSGLTATPCTSTLSSVSESFPAAGGNGSISVRMPTGCSWTAGSNAGWITLSGGSGSGEGGISFSVAANGGTASRTGTIAVAGQIFTVTQAGTAAPPPPPPTPPPPPVPEPCVYSIGPTNAAIAASGGPGSITVSAGTGCAWTATSNASGWLTVSSGASGSGNGTVTFAAAANGGSERTGTMTVAGHTFTVTQAAAPPPPPPPPPPCSYSISPTSVSIGKGAKTGTVSVSAGSGCGWTASSNVSWITVTAGSSGSGNGSVAYSVSQNRDDDRTGTVTIAGQTFTVEQKD